MAARMFDVEEVLERLDDDNGLSSDDESDFEGEGIHGYLPEADGYLFDDMASRGALEDGEEFFEEDGSGSASPGLPAGPLPGQFYS